MIGLYQSITGLVGAFTTLGIGSSGVREIAAAYGENDEEKIAQSVKTLRRACWVTGLLGWVLTAMFSYPLSLWAFGSGERSAAIALLGGTLLLSSISGGQTALLRGACRIGDIARLNVLSVLLGTVVAIGIYAWLGEQGIVPVLLTTATFNLLASWWFARKVEVISASQTLSQSWQYSKRLVKLGLAFMWNGFLTAGVTLAIRTIIVRDLGLVNNGIYQAAWGISGMFAGIILGAMGADLYPRLTAVADDNDQVNQLVNEQTEIGILLALPGIIATLAFAPWIMVLFYTTKFLPGTELLSWFILGVFGRIISWPMGFILPAKGNTRWFVATETFSSLLHLCLCLLLIPWLGLWGVAVAYAGLDTIYIILMLSVSSHLCNFSWTAGVRRLLVIASILIGTGFSVQHWIHGLPALAIGGLLTVATSIVSLRGIAKRLGAQHRLVNLVCHFPAGRKLCGF